MNTATITAVTARRDELVGPSLYVPGVDRFVARTDATARVLERVVRGRAPTAATVTAAVVLAHLRGSATPPDAAMVLVDALIEDRAPRATLLDAVARLGAERAVALLRRALRMLRAEDAVREVGAAMVTVAFGGAVFAREALTLEQHLALATLARHPSLWSHDVAWLAALGLPATREGLEALVATGA